MADHAKYAPSSSKRWLNCPGSINLLPEEGVADSPSIFAWEGTVCHDISAICLKTKKPASEWLGQIVNSVDDGERTGADVEITQELVDAIQMYVDEVNSMASEMQVKGGKVEFKVNITNDCWGTVDAALWNEDTLAVIDAKFGKGVIVEAENNTQMRLYGIGALKMLKEADQPIPKKVSMTIIQPRTVNPVREETLPIAMIQNWAMNTLAPALTLLRKRDMTCNAGDHCMWCPVDLCTVRAKKMLDKAEQAFEPFTGVDNPAKEIATSGDLLKIEAMAKLALSFKAIEDWMKDVRGFLVTTALAGEDVPHFKLVAGRSVRKWGTNEMALVKFLKDNAVDPYESKLKTPPAVEKEMGKKKAKEINLNDHIIKPEGNPTLVPATDKRPALEANVEKSFEEFAVSDPCDDPIVEPVVIDKKDTIVVEEDGGTQSLMQRLMSGASDEPVEEKVEEHVITATEVFTDEVTPEQDLDALAVEEERPKKGTPKPPKAPKRLQILEAILAGPSTLALLVDECGVSENSVKMHIRYLHERDGYGYKIFEDGVVTIIE